MSKNINMKAGWRIQNIIPNGSHKVIVMNYYPINKVANYGFSNQHTTEYYRRDKYCIGQWRIKSN